MINSSLRPRNSKSNWYINKGLDTTIKSGNHTALKGITGPFRVLQKISIVRSSLNCYSLELSPHNLFENLLVQSEIRNSSAKTSGRLLHILYPLNLTDLQSAIRLAPSVESLLCHVRPISWTNQTRLSTRICCTPKSRSAISTISIRADRTKSGG